MDAPEKKEQIGRPGKNMQERDVQGKAIERNTDTFTKLALGQVDCKWTDCRVGKEEKSMSKSLRKFSRKSPNTPREVTAEEGQHMNGRTPVQKRGGRLE